MTSHNVSCVRLVLDAKMKLNLQGMVLSVHFYSNDIS